MEIENASSWSFNPHGWYSVVGKLTFVLTTPIPFFPSVLRGRIHVQRVIQQCTRVPCCDGTKRWGGVGGLRDDRERQINSPALDRHAQAVNQAHAVASTLVSIVDLLFVPVALSSGVSEADPLTRFHSSSRIPRHACIRLRNIPREQQKHPSTTTASFPSPSPALARFRHGRREQIR